MLGCRSALTPAEPGHKPRESWDKTPTYGLNYQKLAGKVI